METILDRLWYSKRLFESKNQGIAYRFLLSPAAIQQLIRETSPSVALDTSGKMFCFGVEVKEFVCDEEITIQILNHYV